MITVHFNSEIFTATEEENGNVMVNFKKEAREALGLEYPAVCMEVEQGNSFDSNIVASGL
jgi:hypothetical protein